VAPTVRSFSAGFDPLRLVGLFPERYPGLLESGTAEAVAGGEPRFDILGIANGERLRLTAGGLFDGPCAAGANGFLDALERWWLELRVPTEGVPADGVPPVSNSPDGLKLPFTGGWLVYLGFEVAAEIEPKLQMSQARDPVVALARRTPAAWLRERTTGRAWLVAERGCEALCERFAADVAALEATMATSREATPAAAPGASLPLIALCEDAPERFLAATRRALEYIASGDIYQANLSREWRGAATAAIDPVAIHARLRATNPAPYAVLLREGEFAVVSSSPERLFAIRAGRVTTRPIAGTRPRGVSREEDLALIAALRANEKERAEHVMLIDLERNDLGRVCRGGSVHVDEYMSVETYAHVHHIVSNLSGELRAGVSPIDVVRAMFPGGTITGCPKVRCMQIIAELEAVARGAYTGSIGYLNRDGSCDFNILIRTITTEGASLRFRAGAGIVADSTPEQELAETRAKAEGLLRALAPVPAA
jgi:anthranilate synthase component 1